MPLTASASIGPVSSTAGTAIPVFFPLAEGGLAEVEEEGAGGKGKVSEERVVREEERIKESKKRL